MWFAIDADTKILQELSEAWETKVFIVKKSKYFITLWSLPSLLIVVLTGMVNVFLFFTINILGTTLQRLLAIVLASNIFFWLFTIFRYLHLYEKIYGIFTIMPASDRIPILKQWDDLFRRFFNQTIFLVLVYILVSLVFGVSIFLNLEQIISPDWLGVLASLVLFLRQLHQVFLLLWRFINLEMDFVVVTREQLKHYNQVNLGLQTTALDADKIKTIKSVTSWWFRSFFDYGEVLILTEWDAVSQADIALTYIKKPNTIEKLITELKQEWDRMWTVSNVPNE